MSRIIKAALVFLVVAAIGGWVSYPLWDGFGPWKALPESLAPSEQRLEDPRYANAALLAQDAIVRHRAEHGFPAISAAVSVNGELIWAGTSGWSDLEAGIAATPDTAFRIGSTSKAVTATILARLIDAGEIDLDAPISTYIGDLPNPIWEDFTPRQLGSHMTGLPEYEANSDLLGGFFTLCGCRHYASVRDSLTIFQGARLRFEPGTDFHYTSFDVNLLAAAMAESQGERYFDLLQEQVTTPLGLNILGGDSDGIERPSLAHFYETDGRRARLWRDFDLSQRWPSGGLVSTSSDLVRIGGAWLDESYISRPTRDALWTPQRLANGEINEQGYAIGWRFAPESARPGDDTRTVARAHHGGVSKGAMSWLVVYPDYGLAIALNINTRAESFPVFSSVGREIAAAFLAEIDPPAP